MNGTSRSIAPFRREGTRRFSTTGKGTFLDRGVVWSSGEIKSSRAIGELERVVVVGSIFKNLESSFVIIREFWLVFLPLAREEFASAGTPNRYSLYPYRNHRYKISIFPIRTHLARRLCEGAVLAPGCESNRGRVSACVRACVKERERE